MTTDRSTRLAVSRRLFAAATALALAGCGGGGSAGAPPPAPVPPPPPPPDPRPSGLYIGTMTRTTNGVAAQNPLQMLALSDDSLWMFYTRTYAGVLILEGFIECQASYGAGTLQSSNLADPNNGIGPGTLTGTFAADGSITARGVDPVRTIDFAASKAAAATFDPAATATLADVSGNWPATGINGLPGTLDISTGGALTGLYNGGAITGTVAPRAAGGNVFDVQVTFADSLSQLDGVTFAGIAWRSALADGTAQFIWAGVSADRQVFAGMLGVR